MESCTSTLDHPCSVLCRIRQNPGQRLPWSTLLYGYALTACDSLTKGRITGFRRRKFPQILSCSCVPCFSFHADPCSSSLLGTMFHHIVPISTAVEGTWSCLALQPDQSTFLNGGSCQSEISKWCDIEPNTSNSCEHEATAKPVLLARGHKQHQLPLERSLITYLETSERFVLWRIRDCESWLEDIRKMGILDTPWVSVVIGE